MQQYNPTKQTHEITFYNKIPQKILRKTYDKLANPPLRQNPVRQTPAVINSRSEIWHKSKGGVLSVSGSWRHVRCTQSRC